MGRKSVVVAGILLVAFVSSFVPWRAAAQTGPSALPAAVPDGNEWSQSDPTAWWWYHGQTVQQVVDLYTANNARIVDVKVEQASPLLLTVAMVKNTGSYSKAWWWYVDADVAAISARLTANNARLIALQAYSSGGTTKYAVVMVSNTGADAKAWWWYVGQTIPDVVTHYTANNARLIDLDVYVEGGITKYAVIMISNTGSDAKAWWWWTGQTPAQISNLLSTENSRLIHIQQDNPAANTFTVIMEGCPCPYWWWYYGVDDVHLTNLALQNGARIVAIDTYVVGGQKRFAAALINNSDPITSRVGQMLRSGINADGTTVTAGLYLKQIGGPVLAGLEQDRVFEPASTIKVVLGVYAMRQVQSGSWHLTDPITKYFYNNSNGSCPTPVSAAGTETLQNGLREMLWHSDNVRTREISDTFGIANINTAAHTLYGMPSTNVRHLIGCGGPLANQLTLTDAGRLYEGVADGTLLNATNREALYKVMAGKEEFEQEGYDFTGIWSPALDTIINQEAPSGMTLVQKQHFKSQMRLNYKAGGYTLCPTSSCVKDTSVAGWAQLPFCTTGRISPLQYVFGTFMNGAPNTTASDDTFNNTKAELLREQIHKALAAWAPCSYQVFEPLIRR